MSYLVTGALGALGAWTVRSLLDRGEAVVTYDLGGSDHRLRLALSDEELAALPRVNGDVADLAHIERVMEEHDVTGVIHLAALQVPFVRANPTFLRGQESAIVGATSSPRTRFPPETS